jgi:nitronate monooxygenase
MKIPQIIQGGMGVAISNYRLAKTVSMAGQLGVVSGIGVARIVTARLNDGDLSGDVRRALSHFPDQEAAAWVRDQYYIPGGKASDAPYKALPAFTPNPTRSVNLLTVISNFVEVFLAKEGHDGVVGINQLEKVQLPNLASLYGALLAHVDVVLMGAGIPIQIPAVLDRLVQHEAVSYRLDVVGAHSDEEFRVHFDPHEIFPTIAEGAPLHRPAFLPIISSVVLAQALLKRAEGAIDGFVIEGPTAGGHNAPPRGPLNLNTDGEPIYGEKDAVDLNKMKALRLPFWLAGGYGCPEGLQDALKAGASGVQVGTLFAFCEESGMESSLKHRTIEQVMNGSLRVHTSAAASPTGFPFKVVMLAGTAADPAVYEQRERICDLGFLRTLYRRDDGKIGFRCSAEPPEDFVHKGGALEETPNRVCLCNQLAATAGFPQQREGYGAEPPIITSGDDLPAIRRLVDPVTHRYGAQDVLNYILQG